MVKRILPVRQERVCTYPFAMNKLKNFLNKLFAFSELSLYLFMKVHLVKEQTIQDYCTANAGSKIGFEEWLAKLKRADWETAADINGTFSSADLLGSGSERVVFDIGGNSYRMICRYKFARTMAHLSIKWIGTHAEYNKLCGVGKKKKKRSQDDDQYTINLY